MARAGGGSPARRFVVGLAVVAVCVIAGGTSVQADTTPVVPGAPASDQLADAAPSYGLDVTPQDLPIDGSPAQQLANATPDPDNSSATTNAYTVAGGDHLLEVFPGDVNYQNPSGDWVAIKPKLVPTASGDLTNQAAAFDVHFPDTLDAADPVVFTLAGGQKLSETVSGGATAGVVRDDATTVTYPAVLPGVDLQFASTLDGFTDSFILKTAQAATQALSYDVTVSGLTLRVDASGQLSMVDTSGTVVGILPPPLATDSSVDPATGLGAEGTAKWVVTDLGGGSYRLSISVDPAFLATATYPVTVDPSSQNTDPQPTTNKILTARDTWVESANPTAAHGSDPYLSVYNDGAGTIDRAWLNFEVGNQIQKGRILIGAAVEAFPFQKDDPNSHVNLAMGTSEWPSSMNWNNQPDASGIAIPNTVSSTGWDVWDVRDEYQKIIDGNIGTPNHGVRLSAASTSNYTRYISLDAGNATGTPVLFLQYNDEPSVPQLDAPADGDHITYASPRLDALKSTDPNGDDSYTRYQVSTSTDFADDSVWNSGWLDNGDAAVVPAGVLHDGQKYYWRAQAWDSFQMEGYDYPTSNVRSFTVALPHWGTDSRYPLWSDSLGNDMGLDVNEGNGNAVLTYPLDSVATVGGSLDVNLTWNSQDPEDHGAGRGWVLSAGPGAVDARDVPVAASLIDSGNAVQIILKDGEHLDFTQNSSDSDWFTSSGAGAGTVLVLNTDDKTPSNDIYVYKTLDGQRFVFTGDGHLKSATAASTADGSNAATTFKYAYDSAGRLVSVTAPTAVTTNANGDPVINTTTTVSAAYDPSSGDLSKVTISGSSGTARSWGIGRDSLGHLTSITDPLGNAVNFAWGYAFQGDAYITSVTDSGTTGAGNAWKLGYSTPPSNTSATMAQVSSVTDPGTDAHGNPIKTTFDWSVATQYTGQTANKVRITAPNGNVPGVDASQFQTLVSTDVDGYPSMVQGPPEAVSPGASPVRPTTTTIYDTNGNLECERDPAANAIAPGCNDPDNPYSGDGLNTVYLYQDTAPFLLVKKELPYPNPDRSGTRLTTTYNYDEGLDGLLEEGWNGALMLDLPVTRSVDSTIPGNGSWGTGAPAGLTSANGFAVRWSGRIHIAKAGTYSFKVIHDDGLRFSVGTKTFASCWGRTDNTAGEWNCGTNAPYTIKLAARTYNFSLDYRDRTGTAGVQLMWDGGDGGGFNNIPASVFDPGLNLLTSSQSPTLLTTSYAYATAALKARSLPSSLVNTTSGGVSRTESFTYDGYGRTVTDHTAAGTITNAYSTTAPCLATSTDRANAVTFYTCDAAGDITDQKLAVPAVDGSQQGAQTRETVTTYDALGRVIAACAPGYSAGGACDATHGSPSRTVYFPNGAVKATFDPLGNETDFTYTPDGDVATKTLPAATAGGDRLVTTSTYDADGNVLSQTRKLGAVAYTTTHTYDGQDRVTSTLAPGASTPTTYQYDQTGATNLPAPDKGFLTSSVTDSAGVRTTTTTDLLGRKVAVQLGTQVTNGPAATTYTYSSKGMLTRVTDPTGVGSTTSYNDFGESTGVTSNSGPTDQPVSSSTTYDDAGRVLTTTNRLKQTTTYTYDQDGRVLSAQQQGAASPWVYKYDAAGDRVQIKDPRGDVRDWSYDVDGRVSSAYEYPKSGSMTDAQSSWLVTTDHYDADGQLMSVDDPSGKTLCYRYDALGDQLERFATSTSACTGSKIDDETYVYNALAGMVGATDADSGASVVIVPDAADPDRTGQVIAGSAKTTYSYSSSSGQLSQVSSVVGSQTLTTSYAYQATTGWVSGLTDPFSRAQSTLFGYDQAGRVTSRTSASGLQTQWAYDPQNGRLSDETVSNAKTVVAHWGLSYDAGDEVTAEAVQLPSVNGQANPGSGKWAYGYNDQDELVSSQLDGGPKTTYGYDPAGNRTLVSSGSSSITSVFDGAGRQTQSGQTQMTWNADDELVKSGTSTYIYDVWGRETAAQVGSTGEAIAYDGLGRPVSRSVLPGGVSKMTYQGVGDQPETVTQPGGTVTSFELYGDVPIAEEQGTAATAIRSLFQDPHGDVSLYAASAATVTGTVGYTPYGTASAVGSDATGSLVGFQSQPVDPITGLVQTQTRQYNPTSGSFTSRDTLLGSSSDPFSQNQYTYAQNSPVLGTDPTGQRVDTYGWSNADRRAEERREQAGWTGTSGLYIPATSAPGISPLLAIELHEQAAIADLLGPAAPRLACAVPRGLFGPSGNSGGSGRQQSLDPFALVGVGADTAYGMIYSIPRALRLQAARLRGLAWEAGGQASGLRTEANALTEYADAIDRGGVLRYADTASKGMLVIGAVATEADALHGGNSFAHATFEAVGSASFAYAFGTAGLLCGPGAWVCAPVAAVGGGMLGKWVGDVGYNAVKSWVP